jgi:hypothetical protein
LSKLSSQELSRQITLHPHVVWLANVLSCQKLGTWPYPSSANSTCSSYPSLSKQSRNSPRKSSGHVTPAGSNNTDIESTVPLAGRIAKNAPPVRSTLVSFQVKHLHEYHVPGNEKAKFSPIRVKRKKTTENGFGYFYIERRYLDIDGKILGKVPIKTAILRFRGSNLSRLSQLFYIIITKLLIVRNRIIPKV